MSPPVIIRPVAVDPDSPFFGEQCALCKEQFADGDKLVICPRDGSRHHSHCWEANGNKCTAYGCTGHGEVQHQPRRARRSQNGPTIITQEGRSTGSTRSKVRAMPSSNFGCAQSCLLIAIALAIVLIAFGCFGLWAIADFIVQDVLGWQYRTPVSGALPAGDMLMHLSAMRTVLPL